MDPWDEYIFCQKDLASSSFSVFEDMRRSEVLTDVKLVVSEGRSFVGHRVVLAAAIPYFREVCTCPAEDVALKKIDSDALESIINFAYSGEIHITSANAESLLSASEFLQLDQVHGACWEFLEKRLHSNNVWRIRELAANHGCTKMIEAADHFIREKFEKFSRSDSFLTLPFSYFKKVITRDDISVSTEDTVLEAVISWVKFSPSEREYLLTELLSAVRMTNLTPEYLAETVSSEELLRTSTPCRNLIEEVKLYQSMLGETSKFLHLKTRPRISVGAPHSITYISNTISHYGIYALCTSVSGLSVKFLDSENWRWLNISTSGYKGLCHVAAFGTVIYAFTAKGTVTFDVKTRLWNSLEDVHEDESCSVSVSHDHRIYFFGGEDDLAQTVRCFDPRFDKWLPPTKMSCYGHKCSGVASLSKCIYITGGYNARYCVLNACTRYNPQVKEWTELAPMLSKRYGHGCIGLNGKIYVCGGYDANHRFLNSAEVYDPVTNKWADISFSGAPRLSQSFIPSDGKLYAVGRVPKTSNPTINIEIYDPEHNKSESDVPPIRDDDYFEVLLVTAPVPSEIVK